MNLRPFLFVEIALAIVVLAMLTWRKMVARQEDDMLHVLDGAPVDRQATVAHKLDTIDRWGKTLTVIVVVLGIVLAGAYVYQSWIQASSHLAGE